MSHSTPLLDSLQQAITCRTRDGMTLFCLDDPLPSSAPDFFSNDYLSLSTDPILRDQLLRRFQAAPRIFGSTGSRIATGNYAEYNTLEQNFQTFFSAPSALLFGSGFTANLAFLTTVPQKNDVIIYDELIHSSCREGIRASSSKAALYRFSHNSIASFQECLRNVLHKHPQITQGTSTVFVVVESLYSVDGDLTPLREIVELVESLVPAGHSHIMVDEAHTSGICGPNGTGYVSMLGLSNRVHTIVHTFGKAWGYHGAVVLTSPIVRNYLINFAKSFIFSTSMPYPDIYALQVCLDAISSTRGHEVDLIVLPPSNSLANPELLFVPFIKLRQSLYRLSRYAHRRLPIALREIPESILGIDTSGSAQSDDHGFCSPIIPIFTPYVSNLTDYLLQRGHGVLAGTYPIVNRPRIRVIIHARNTEEEIDSLISELLAWAESQKSVVSHTRSGSDSAGTVRPSLEARARL